MGAALDRLAQKLERSAIVDLAKAFVPRHPGRTSTGGITDVDAYFRQYKAAEVGPEVWGPTTRKSGRAQTRKAGQQKRGESGYMYSPRRDELGPSPSKASRLMRGTTETRADRRARLQKKLVDYKPERPLAGGEDIRQVIPGTEVKDYLDLPFLSKLHDKMGIDVDTASTEEYMSKRNDLFSAANTKDEEVPFDGLVTTQQVVNREQARKFIGQEFDPPPYVVRYKGTNYVINGHHRVVAEALAGKTGTRARVLELD